MPNDLPALGKRLQILRKSRKMSLEELASSAGVSKSMVSQIERNEANPTVAVLWRLTNALSVPLAEFLEVEDAGPTKPEIFVLAAHSTPVIKSPDGKCHLKILGPPELAGRTEWYELEIEPGGILSSDAHSAQSKEHLTALSGEVVVDVEGATSRLRTGETARYPVDRHHSISNDTATTARLIMIIEYPAG